MCRKSMTRDPRFYFPSEGSHTQDFYVLKKIHPPRPGLNPRTSDPQLSMITTGPPGSTEETFGSLYLGKKSSSKKIETSFSTSIYLMKKLDFKIHKTIRLKMGTKVSET